MRLRDRSGEEAGYGNREDLRKRFWGGEFGVWKSPRVIREIQKRRVEVALRDNDLVVLFLDGKGLADEVSRGSPCGVTPKERVPGKGEVCRETLVWNHETC